MKFFVRIRGNKKTYKFSMQDSLYVILVIIVMLFSCLMCFFIGSSMIKAQPFHSVTYNDEIFQAIVDQQSKTLAIASLCVAMASLINTILSIFRTKKLQQDKKTIEELEQNISTMENTLKTMSSINAIQILESKDSECYYDTITQYLDINQQNKHVKLALLSLQAVISRSKENKKSQELNCYDEIIRIASSILASDSISPIERHFALLESVNALYKRARINLYKENVQESIKEDLTKAQQQLDQLSKINPSDTFGHIDNLKGLVHFWTAKIETNKIKELQELQSAKTCFTQAIEKNKDRVEFLNHLGVVMIGLYKTSSKHATLKEIEKMYKEIKAIDGDYFKAYLNLANIYMTELENAFDISSVKPLSKVLTRAFSPEIIKKAEKFLKKAEKELQAAKKLAPSFIDNHYKLGALLTYKYLIKKLEDPNYDDEKLKKAILACFEKADSIIPQATKTLVYKRNFYNLIGDSQQANVINDILIERKDPYAIQWRENLN